MIIKNSIKALILGAIIGLFLGACAPFPELPDDVAQPETSDEGPESEANGSSEGDSDGGDSSAVPSAANSSGNGESGPDLVAPAGLVLNEIYYDVPGSDTDGQLFIELFTASGGNLDFYQIRFINGDSGAVTEVIDLPESADIADQGFYVIADGRTGALETTQVSMYDLIDNFDPQNGPDGVQLLDRAGQLVDSVVYGAGAVATSEDGLALGEGVAAADPDSGFSLERLEAGLDTDDNATDFVINESPSPGL